MTPLTIGSLCTGYGGLDLAVQETINAAPLWFADNDPAASRILHHHWPTVPNLGDITAINWRTTPPVNILTAGFPCQPFAAAGQRQGTNDDRHLWPYIRTAIRHLRPDYIYLENVAGLRSLGLDRVLGDMAEDGLHVEWESLRASTIGAPHHRERIFILATPPDTRGQELPRGPRLRPNETTPLRRRRPSHRHNQTHNFGPYTPAIQRWEQRTTAAPPPTRLEGLNHADHAETRPPEVLRNLREGVFSQAIQRETGRSNEVPEPQDMRTVVRKQQESSASGLSQMESAADSQPRGMLTVPSDRESTCPSQGQEPREQRSRQPDDSVRELPPETALGGGQGVQDARNTEVDWGQYTQAIRRWERILGRAAPNPTELNRNGKPHLAAEFSSWMMGLPPGHITEVPGLTRAQQLNTIGNGVCPQQAAAALTNLLNRTHHPAGETTPRTRTPQ